MNELVIFTYLLYSWLGLAGIIFILLFFFKAPYGRHFSNKWGLSINNKAGWILMEAISAIVFASCFIFGSNYTITTIIFFVMWQTHYIHRGFIYPFTIKSRKRIMPFAVISMGLVFNLINAYLNGRHVFTFSTAYDNQWMAEPQFAVGVFLFVTGFIINRKADSMLVNLRSNKGQEYSIPRGGLFEYVSCPNYLGEIIIWVGWAIATWSLPGLAFALWTVANLAPRSKSHHQWYRATFSTYPNRRKALIPYIW